MYYAFSKAVQKLHSESDVFKDGLPIPEAATHALDPYCSTGMSCVHLLLNILYSIGTILLH